MSDNPTIPPTNVTQALALIDFANSGHPEADRFTNHLYAAVQILSDSAKQMIKTHRRKSKPNYIFLTVNMIQNLPEKLEQLQKAVKKCVHKKWVQSASWSFELSPENEHLHAHILLEKPPEKPMSQCKVECKSTFKNICHTDNSALFNWKPVSDPDNFFNYIEKSAEKEQTEATFEFRKLHNLQNIYHREVPDHC